MNDDGSLSFLQIKPNEASKHFNGREVTQQSLINTTFWICDYVKDVKTKYGEGRYLVKGKHYFRYADDMVFFGADKEGLHDLLKEINKQMDMLKLKVKDNWQIFPTDARGVDFLGYVFYHDHTMLRKSIKKRMFRKASKVKRLPKDQKHQAMASWIGWLQYCNSGRLKVKLNTRLKDEIFKQTRGTKVHQG